MDVNWMQISRRRLLAGTAGLAAGTGLAGGLLQQPATAAVRRNAATAPGAAPAGAAQIARLIGHGGINATDTQWGVYGTDLGHMFMHQGRIAMVFGDTLGAPAADNFWSVPHQDWRSNTMAWINLPQDPGNGLVFASMVTDQPGHAKELLSSKKVSGVEQTVIPTYGAGVADRLLLHYMSVNNFGAPGHWTLNYSGIAYSDDGGQNWTKDPDMTWPGTSNFGQVAIVEERGWLYLFGIPGGRYGGVQLARVRPHEVLRPASYQYWDGTGWEQPVEAAATIVPAPVGELSVRWNSFYRRWLMMYLDDPDGLIVLRTAPQLTGPWSAPRVITTSAQYPALYAPYITPLWNEGPDIYFTMSLYGPYAVYLMRTSLTA